MSIDTRLRHGLGAEADRLHEVDVVDAWTGVVRRAERDTARRRARVAALAVAAAVVVAITVAVLTRGTDGVQPAPAVPTPSPTETSPTTDATEASPVEGKWLTGAVPVRRVIRHLGDEGFGEEAMTVVNGLRPDLEDIRPGQSISFRLILQDGQLVGGVSVDGNTASDVDFQSYEIRGERIAFIQQGTGCEARFAWTVTDDRLRLRLLSDPCADYQGTPDAAYLTALYTALPFSRFS
jgi:hypothetical protein